MWKFFFSLSLINESYLASAHQHHFRGLMLSTLIKKRKKELAGQCQREQVRTRLPPEPGPALALGWSHRYECRSPSGCLVNQYLKGWIESRTVPWRKDMRSGLNNPLKQRWGLGTSIKIVGTSEIREPKARISPIVKDSAVSSAGWLIGKLWKNTSEPLFIALRRHLTNFNIL